MIKYKELEGDKRLFRELRKILTRSERLWLLDCSGDYFRYRERLKKLAAAYKIEVPSAR